MSRTLNGRFLEEKFKSELQNVKKITLAMLKFGSVELRAFKNLNNLENLDLSNKNFANGSATLYARI
jgi:hypothetical protein